MTHFFFELIFHYPAGGQDTSTASGMESGDNRSSKVYTEDNSSMFMRAERSLFRQGVRNIIKVSLLKMLSMCVKDTLGHLTATERSVEETRMTTPPPPPPTLRCRGGRGHIRGETI